jgi:hypothetical protein
MSPFGCGVTLNIFMVAAPITGKFTPPPGEPTSVILAITVEF